MLLKSNVNTVVSEAVPPQRVAANHRFFFFDDDGKTVRVIKDAQELNSKWIQVPHVQDEPGFLIEHKESMSVRAFRSEVVVGVYVEPIVNQFSHNPAVRTENSARNSKPLVRPTKGDYRLTRNLQNGMSGLRSPTGGVAKENPHCFWWNIWAGTGRIRVVCWNEQPMRFRFLHLFAEGLSRSGSVDILRKR